MAKKSSVALVSTSDVITVADPAMLATQYTLKKIDGVQMVEFAPQLAATVFDGAQSLIQTEEEKHALCVNMWNLYKYMVMGKIEGPHKGLVGALPFYRAFDKTKSFGISAPKPGSKERKDHDSNKMLNKLRYMTERLGKKLAGDNPVAPSKEERKQTADADKARFLSWVDKYKTVLNPMIVSDALMAIGMTTEDKNNMVVPTPKAKAWYKAALAILVPENNIPKAFQ